MLLQTNSYLVPRDRRAEHARLMRRFDVCFERLGSDFTVFEQVGPGFAPNDPQASATRFVQMMRFRDAEHHRQVQEAEAADDVARRLIADFCRLIDLDSQQRQGLYAGGFYNADFDPERPHPPAREGSRTPAQAPPHGQPRPEEARPSPGDDVDLVEFEPIDEPGRS